MILTIDIGNTNIVAACFEGDRMVFCERFSTEPGQTGLEYATVFKTSMEIYGLNPRKVDGGIICSVVPSVTNTVKEAVEKLTGAAFIVAGPGVKTGLKIKVEEVAQQGTDLIVAAAAGVYLYDVPQIIVDMGTATTVSVIDKDGAYIGKMILPGVALSLEALSNHAAQLPRISLEPPKKLIGGSTVDSMKSGILFGSAGAVDGLIDRVEEELGCSCTLVATGGLAGTIVPLCRHRMIMDEDLVMKGLLLIYYRNHKS